MLLRQYRILLLRPNGSPWTTILMRTWLLPALALPFLVLLAGLCFFTQHFGATRQMEERLAIYQDQMIEQRSMLLDLSRQLQSAQRRTNKVQQLNAKLRLMLQMDENQLFTPQQNIGGLGAAPLYAMLPFKRILPLHLHKQSDALEHSLLDAEVQQLKIIATLSERKEHFDHMPSIWPVKGRFSSGFGYRTSPFTGKKDFHKGVDITGPRGTPIYAPASGVVIFAEHFSTYGKTIRLLHSDNIETLYAHLHKIAVEVGQEVTRGELIGYVGNTGRSTASHLHYEVHVNEKLVDPMHYILN